MNRPSFRLSAALVAAVVLAACGDSTGPDPRKVESVDISPDDPTMFVGEEVQLEATARNSSGEAVSGKTASWSSSNTSVATVTANGGVVTGVAAGSAQITALIDGKSASVTVTVNVFGTKPTVTGISPSPLVPGASATLTGEDLTTTTQVYVNGARAFVSAASATSVQFQVPCVAPGAATVVARNGSADSDAFAATVNATSSAPMAVGDFRTLAGTHCLQLPASGNQTYLIGVQSISETVSSLTPVTFGIDGAAAAAAADVAAASALVRTTPALGAFRPTLSGDPDQARWSAHRRAEHDLRAQDLATTRAMLRTFGGQGGIATFESTTAAAVPAVGDVVEMRYPDTAPGKNLCTDFVPVTGRVQHVSARAIFVADTANPDNGFTAADYTHFGSVFDDSIYDPQVTYFGAPTDLDDNQRIIVLLTKEVNRRDNILGMVVSSDFFPRGTGAGQCASSDYGEIYYGRVPDPNGEFGQAYPVASARLDVPALIAHEMTHIIQFGRRLQVPNATDYQALWEMESQATLAEEVIGHRFNLRQTGQNYGFDVAWENCESNATGIAWYCDKFQDLALYYGFLSATTRAPGAPEQCTFVGRIEAIHNVPCHEGQKQRAVYTGWSFLRWLSDHYGDDLGGEGQLHRQLIDNTIGGFQSIADVVGVPIDELLGRWAATLYTDDRFAGVGGLLSLPSWNLYDIEQHLNVNAHLEPYQHTFTDASRDVSVRAGSSAYFLVSGSRLATAIRATSPNGATLPSPMRLWVARVQ
ncbi:MAG TPA: Ig-like domain-containing protein [Longimicrobiales bacterium]|nr:Ig-like domain-containing protein [Longimicrobiales bacterium]